MKSPEFPNTTTAETVNEAPTPAAMALLAALAMPTGAAAETPDVQQVLDQMAANMDAVAETMDNDPATNLELAADQRNEVIQGQTEVLADQANVQAEVFQKLTTAFVEDLWARNPQTPEQTTAITEAFAALLATQTELAELAASTEAQLALSLSMLSNNQNMGDYPDGIPGDIASALLERQNTVDDLKKAVDEVGEIVTASNMSAILSLSPEINQEIKGLATEAKANE